MLRKYSIVATNAPADYDWSYSLPYDRADLHESIARRVPDGWRVVVMRSKHVDIQTGRYFSGLYGARVVDSFETSAPVGWSS